VTELGIAVYGEKKKKFSWACIEKLRARDWAWGHVGRGGWKFKIIFASFFVFVCVNTIR
jgi:hypothetical protein